MIATLTMLLLLVGVPAAYGHDCETAEECRTAIAETDAELRRLLYELGVSVAPPRGASGAADEDLEWERRRPGDLDGMDLSDLRRLHRNQLKLKN